MEHNQLHFFLLNNTLKKNTEAEIVQKIRTT